MKAPFFAAACAALVAFVWIPSKNEQQVADYECTRQEICEYTYELQRIEGKDTVIKVPRSK